MGSLLYDYLLLVNKSSLSSSNDEMVLFLLENYRQLPFQSLRFLADQSYFSQYSFSKLLKSQQISYKQLQVDSGVFQKELEQVQDNIFGEIDGLTARQIADTCFEQMHANIDQVQQQLDIHQVVEAAKMLKQSRSVVLIGSDFSMSMTGILQSALFSLNIPCYTMLDPEGQKNMIQRLGPEDCCVFVSIRQRWYKDYPEVRDALFRSACKKMLWTTTSHHLDEDKFDSVIHFGKNINKYSYMQLMTFIPIITHILMSQNPKG